MQRRLKTAATGVDTEPLMPLKGYNTMQLFVLPAVRLSKSKPKLKLVERPVFVRGKWNMELLVLGNRAGLLELCQLFNKATSFADHGLDEHVQFDHYDDFVVAPSVALNIRAPVRKWQKERLEPYSKLIFGPYQHSFPKDLDYLKPYRYRRPKLDAPYFSLT